MNPVAEIGRLQVRRLALAVALASACLAVVAPHSASALLSFASPVKPNGERVRDMDCTSPTFCAYSDDAGHVISSTNPTGGVAAWTVVGAAPGDDLYAISCSGTAFCITGGLDGKIYASSSPASPGSWSLVYKDSSSAPEVEALSCPSASLCVAVDHSGNVITSTTPTVANTWAPVTLESGHSIRGLSCAPATSFCVAATGATGNAWVSSNPTGGAGAWSKVAIDAGVDNESVSCASSAFCGVLNTNEEFISDTDNVWATGFLIRSPAVSVDRLSCPTSSFCAITDAGHFASSTNPTGGKSAWSSQEIDGSTELEGMSCTSAYFCVAGDNNGNVLYGTEAPPLTTTIVGEGTIAGGGIACPGTCSKSFVFNTAVVLTATAATGSTFAGWGGACSGTATCNLTVNGPQNVTATFTVTPPAGGGQASNNATSNTSVAGNATKAPTDTHITKATISSRKRTARFTFSASGTVTSFQCELKRPRAPHHKKPPVAKFASCKSPTVYGGLRNGSYEFLVRAVGPGGADVKPARKMFKVI